jgi:hypothetical protein
LFRPAGSSALPARKPSAGSIRPGAAAWSSGREQRPGAAAGFFSLSGRPFQFSPESSFLRLVAVSFFLFQFFSFFAFSFFLFQFFQFFLVSVSGSFCSLRPFCLISA